MRGCNPSPEGAADSFVKQPVRPGAFEFNPRKRESSLVLGARPLAVDRAGRTIAAGTPTIAQRAAGLSAALVSKARRESNCLMECAVPPAREKRRRRFGCQRFGGRSRDSHAPVSTQPKRWRAPLARGLTRIFHPTDGCSQDAKSSVRSDMSIAAPRAAWLLKLRRSGIGWFSLEGRRRANRQLCRSYGASPIL
jgi:hypothetical protein